MFLDRTKIVSGSQEGNLSGFFVGLSLDVQFEKTGLKSRGPNRILQKVPKFMADPMGGFCYSPSRGKAKSPVSGRGGRLAH